MNLRPPVTVTPDGKKNKNAFPTFPKAAPTSSARGILKVLPSKRVRESTSCSNLLKPTPRFQKIKKSSLTSANAHGSRSGVFTPLKADPEEIQKENQGPRISSKKKEVNLTKGQGSKRDKGTEVNVEVMNLEKSAEPKKKKVKLVGDENMAKIKMLADMESKVELVMVTDKEVDKINEVCEAGKRPKKRIRPTMVADEEAAEILETEKRPTKRAKNVLLRSVMITDENVPEVLETETKPIIVAQEHVAGIKPSKMVAKLVMVYDGDVAEVRDVTMSNKALNIKELEKSQRKKTKLKLVIGSYQNKRNIDMKTNVIKIEKQDKKTWSDRRVKLTMVMDGKAAKVNDI